MRFLPIVLLLGIVFNSVVVLVYRVKSERDFSRRYDDFRQLVNSQMHSLTVDALSRIDNYFLSNSVLRAQSANSPANSVVDIPSPFYENSGNWNYHFMVVDGYPAARVGFSDFFVGSPFPRGGVITAIYPDGVCIDDRYFVNNSSSFSQIPALKLPEKSDNKMEVVKK